MKFIITESKIESIVFKYLDNQDFVKIEKSDNIFFINPSDKEYFQIIYVKDDGWCFIYVELVDEISSFFSLEELHSKNIIGKWVENTLQMKVSNTDTVSNNFYRNLRIGPIKIFNKITPPLS